MSGYNGWTNYETWACKLWIDNDEGSYRYWGARAQDAWDNAEAHSVFTKEQDAAHTLADELREEIEQGAPQLEGMYADLLTSAISEINWREIAENLLEDVDKAQDEEDEEE